MDSQAGHVMTIANSIIGVSLLAMPYCFKQCGILLSVLILILSNAISRLSCHLMLKSAVMTRRRTFEFLAFHAFGPLGKFITEVGLIGFLLGTCIAYFVVMGDLGPAIISKMTGARATDTMRTSILMALALFCVLPLGLLRNIDSLNSVCTATIGFYFCLVLKIMAESAPHIFSGDWVAKVELWRPAGILQCLPIFSMALSCQTQIFEVYQAIPTASLEKMNNLIRVAVNICTSVYVFVGIFGYIAFANQTFTGNILMSFSTSLLSDVMKIGFVLSLAFSFPLIIFPCRASLYSLLYRRLQTYALHEGTDKYIPESRFKGLTFIIVLVSLVIGVMIPNIELVLGLVGSTIGIMVCVLFPATCFICISTKNTNERILAQIMLFVGVLIMVLGTYANLYSVDDVAVAPTPEKVTIRVPDILKLVEEDPALKVIDIPNTTKRPVDWKPQNKEELSNKDAVKEVRHEPPQPEEPAESHAEVKAKNDVKEADHIDKPGKDQQKDMDVKEEVGAKPIDAYVDKPINQLDGSHEKKKALDNIELQQPIEEPKASIIKNLLGQDKVLIDDSHIGQGVDANNNKNQDIHPQKESNVNLPPLQEPETFAKTKEQEAGAKSNAKKVEEVDIEAIKKEEKELFEQEKEKLKEEEKKNSDLIKKMEQQNEDQKKLVEASKKLLEELKQKQKELDENKQQNEIDKVKQEKMKAVEQIEEIAKEAIKKLSGDEKESVQALDKSNKVGKDDKIGAIAKQAIEKISGGDQQNQAQLRDDSKREEKAELIEDVAKKAIEKISKDKPSDGNVQLENNAYKEAKSGDIQINPNSADQGQYLNDNVNPNNLDHKNLNVNNDLKQNADNKGSFKLALNKGNIVPLPIAISNNFSGSYRNLVAPVNDVPKDSVPNLQAIDSAIVKLDNNQQIESKPRVEKPSDIKNDLQEKVMEKERDQINILDFLKTNAEKVTALDQAKQVKGIQHREIRSASDEAFLEIDKKEGTLENIDKLVKGQNGEGDLKKAEDSCDKGDKNVGQESVNNVDQAGTTETPIIRMITKLSEPELVSIKLPDIVDSSILKPLKRDLKSYKFRKRK